MPSSIQSKPKAIAIVGNPNSGKTTLFNKLTGLRQKVGNYPGVTVEKKIGVYQGKNENINLLDLPGTYGLSPRSEEERIASEIILGRRKDTPPVDGLVIVVDSTALERSLYLVLQTLRVDIPKVLLLNMTDELENRGAEIDIEKLSSLLNIPVIPITATKKINLDRLGELMESWPRHDKPFPDDLEFAPTPKQIAARRTAAKEIAKSVFKKNVGKHPWSDKIDAVVLSRLWGPLVFAGVVMVVFQSIFSWAEPLMNGIDALFGWVGGQAQSLLPEGMINSFVVEGIIAGVGSVVIFLPQILIVFFFIAILENSGYMARAATVMDHFFMKIGLQGKSFLPLISSYACAVPGIMAARTIESKHDRLATILIAPFMTCSARLPVYALLISAFVPKKEIIPGLMGLQSLTLLGLYLVGFLAAAFTALVLKSSFLKSDKTPFILDIPPYRIPDPKTIFLLMWDRSKIFLRRAGTIIMGTAIILWALIYFPQNGLEGSAQVEQSYAGRIGKAIEPAIKPLGFDWKIGVGLLAAQSAREVFVSAISTLNNVGDPEEGDFELKQKLKEDMTPLTAVSLMVFFVFAMQCMSTIAITRRETGGWKIPALMFIYMNAYAYVASLIVYQGGKALGFG